MGTKRPFQKGCFGGVLLISLIFSTLKLKTCSLFLFTY